MAKKQGFNTPFEALKNRPAVKAPETKPASKPASKPIVTREPRTPEPRTPEPIFAKEDQLFADEMSGVAPIAEDPRGRLGAPKREPRPGARRVAEDAEVLATLSDLVSGTGAFDIESTDEFIEGVAPGVDRRLLRRLKKGDYALEAHVDLHGLSAEEAREEIGRFVSESRTKGKRCLLVIHGRGLHSKDQIPVLKERLRVWLSRGSLAKAVLAFCTARPADGGLGAMYLLLRR